MARGTWPNSDVHAVAPTKISPKFQEHQEAPVQTSWLAVMSLAGAVVPLPPWAASWSVRLAGNTITDLVLTKS